MFAGLVPALLRSPCRPGSVYVISITTEVGSSTYSGLPLLRAIVAPALYVLSTTLPVTTFFSLVRTNAPPLPGLTCWNSTTFQSWPSMLSTTPLRMSAVDATGGPSGGRGREEQEER